MIDSFNQKTPLDVAQRKVIFNRALHSIPYFYKMTFAIVAEANLARDYRQSVGINRDFFLTEVMSNFGEVAIESGSLFNLSVYTALLRSLYRYNASQLLPASFYTQEARLRAPFVNQIYDDRQREVLPTLIRANDKVFCDIKNLDVKASPSTAHVVLKGFTTNDAVFINPREQAQINKSLEDKEKYQYFDFNITTTGRTQIVKENDNKPRLILGFGITNSGSNKELATDATVSIQDISRHLKLTDTEIPVQFIAPRLVCSLDSYIYYLPIEYYWQPNGFMEFSINNIPVTSGDAGFRFTMLTRTV